MSRGPGRVMLAVQTELQDERIIKIDAHELACRVHGVHRATESQINSVIRAFKRIDPDGWEVRLDPWRNAPISQNGRVTTGHITTFVHKARHAKAIKAAAAKMRGDRDDTIAALTDNERVEFVQQEVADMHNGAINNEVLAAVAEQLRTHPIDLADVNHLTCRIIELHYKRKERLERLTQEKIDEANRIAALRIAAE